jgi:pimeloyl-ACP methyl ester carboxylesterase
MKRSSLRKQLYLLFLFVFTVACFTAVPTFAAPIVGPAGMTFYDKPATIPGTHGTLIKYRTSTSVPSGAPSCYSWTIMYASQDAQGVPNVVTGTVLVPKSLWNYGLTARPIISYAVGTHGLAQSWAPSIQLENGTDYENSNIKAALGKGYAVVITDNPGFTNGDVPSYMVGISQGKAVLDIVTAATQIPNISLKSYAKVGIWGYSQGGQSAAWAGQLQPTYASGIKLAGVAAGGVPAELFAVGRYLDGNNGSSFLLETCIGLNEQYPNEIKLYDRVNASGLAAIDEGLKMGVFEGLFAFMNTPLSNFTLGGETSDQIFAIPEIASVVNGQALGKTKINVPVFLYHGTADEFIPLPQALDLKTNYCSRGTNTSFMVFPGEHITTQFQAAPYVLDWLADRFNGRTAASTCSTSKPRPTSTANPVDGDFLFSLDNWTLEGKIKLKTLMTKVELPEGSTFSAETNMTNNTITGGMSVPEFDYYIYAFGMMPLQVTLKIVPAGPMTGTASLDDNGNLHINGHVFADIYLKEVGELDVGIPFTLKTEKPVDFPIVFDGPVSSLGDGSLTFTGTTTFPDMVKNGVIINTMFSALMSGPGQEFTFTVKPPAPYKW